jgi:putative addiction module antidote
MKKSKIRAIGNSLGIVIPKAMLDRLQLREGDAVYLVERTDGIEVRVGDPEFARQAELLRDGMRTYRNAMTELAR